MSISVAMTTYNGESFLAPALRTLLDQTRLPDEIVIADDASTDDTREILRAFARTSSVPVRLIIQRDRIGLRLNMTCALERCSSDVIARADQDDMWETGKVAAITTGFGDSDVTLWFSDATLIDSSNQPLGITAWEAVRFDHAARELVRQGRGLVRLLHGQTVTGTTMAIHADVLKTALPLPSETGTSTRLYLHDGWLALVAMMLGRVVCEEECFTCYRQHAAQVTQMSMVRLRQGPSVIDRDRRLAVESARVALLADRLRLRSDDVSLRCDPVRFSEFGCKRISVRGSSERRKRSSSTNSERILEWWLQRVFGRHSFSGLGSSWPFHPKTVRS